MNIVLLFDKVIQKILVNYRKYVFCKKINCKHKDFSLVGKVTIGKYTDIAAQCYIIDMDHGIMKENKICNQCNFVAPVFIGNDVWIASNVTILKGSIIKNGAVIGAKGLVKGEVKENAVAVGIPVKTIRYRV